MLVKSSDVSTVCIVGGGSSAHVLIPFLSQQTHHKIHLLTRRPTEWQEVITCELTDMNNVVLQSFHGHIDKKSSDPLQVIPEADIIILCLPVHQYRGALNKIGSCISTEKQEIFVGTIYGQAGFNWMVHEMVTTFNLSNIITFAIGLIPWICRTKIYGSKVANYGGKQRNIVAVSPKEKFECLNERFLKDISLKPLGIGQFLLACNFLSLTLSVDNQIIHPARCYGLWTQSGGRWSSMETVPFFYKDFDEVSSRNMGILDDEYTSIRNAIRSRYPERLFTYMLPYLELERLVHDSNHLDILESFRNSKQLSLIKPPVVVKEVVGEVVLDVNSRFFTDDIPYGLVIAKWIAEQLDVETPFIAQLIMWSDTLRHEHWMNEQTLKLDMAYCIEHKYSTGIPPSYDITDIDMIIV